MSDWRTYLQALPEAEPPEALWQRIAQARAAAVARRRAPRWLAGAGLAAAVALAAVLALPRGGEAPQVEPPVAALARTVAARDGEALRALDDAIALAYAHHASQDELDSLWQTRERLLGSPAESEPLLARL
jgi:hypothetical protein